jgi:tetratricopeptide (TPR) repeat protein
MARRIQQGGKKLHVWRAVWRAVWDLDFLKEGPKQLRLIEDYLKTTSPDDKDLLRLKGNILDISLQYKESAKVYRRLLKLNRYDTLALADLGDSYYNRKKYGKAVKYSDQALMLLKKGRHGMGPYAYRDKDEEFIEACKSKAEALLDSGRPREALNCIIDGLRRDPTDGILGALLQRAQASHERELRRKAKRLNPKRKT